MDKSESVHQWLNEIQSETEQESNLQEVSSIDKDSSPSSSIEILTYPTSENSEWLSKKHVGNQ